MQSADTGRNSRLLPAAGLLVLALLAVLLCGLCTERLLLDAQDPEALQALVWQESGSESAAVSATAEEGNLLAVYWTAGEEAGLLLLERADGLFSSGWRLIGSAAASGNLNVYQTELHGVTTVTVLYGADIAGTASCSTDTGESLASAAGSPILALSVQTGSSGDVQTLQILYE